jgi:hypothetical protein
MTVLLIIIGIIVSYVFVAGTLRTPFAKVSARRCVECKDGKHLKEWKDDYRNRSEWIDSKEYHGETGSIQAAFWPFTLPWTFGSMITGGDKTQKKQLKNESRRAEEIAEAEHQARLAAIRAEEDRHLTQQLQDR